MIPLSLALGLARTWWKVIPGVALGVLVALPVGRCQGVQIQKDRYAVQAAKVRERAADAAEKAAGQRAEDKATVTTTAKERTDAIRKGPDEAPSGAQLRLACQQLRQQGTAPDRLPAECRPGGSGQAAARP